MSAIINPHTNRPVGNNRSISDADLLKVLQAQRVKIDALNQQSMQLGLYLEFIVEHLLALEDANGEPLIQINVEEFPAFAQKRFKEIQEELVELQKNAATEDAEAVLKENPVAPAGLNLNE